MDQNTIDEGKTMGIIAYITFIGTIIAFVMNNDKKNAFASFHIRQMLGIILIGIALNIILRFLPLGSLGFYIGLLPLVLMVMGAIGASQGKLSKVPVLGDQFEEWFKTIG
ncbi:hypothetical protein FF125_13210 [Aureibaculum algae]|uniref:DUF4870 domain-containing protein n=1 Tax=Aureibaculum algae TaxID=2584122 RepID=A0A5B7TSM8_9FLAO|nr:hypothetical protein [Aureibaculum algae]QCX39350.1 hypothetical protein FF125_13210 [Aureibaculum algae]